MFCDGLKSASMRSFEIIKLIHSWKGECFVRRAWEVWYFFFCLFARKSTQRGCIYIDSVLLARLDRLTCRRSHLDTVSTVKYFDLKVNRRASGGTSFQEWQRTRWGKGLVVFQMRRETWTKHERRKIKSYRSWELLWMRRDHSEAYKTNWCYILERSREKIGRRSKRVWRIAVRRANDTINEFVIDDLIREFVEFIIYLEINIDIMYRSHRRWGKYEEFNVDINSTRRPCERHLIRSLRQGSNVSRLRNGDLSFRFIFPSTMYLVLIFLLRII